VIYQQRFTANASTTFMSTQPSKGRETLLAFVLVFLLGGVIFFFLNFISFGIFFYVLIAVAALTMVGMLHYALWGHSLTQEVAGEREEQQVRERMQADVSDD